MNHSKTTPIFFLFILLVVGSGVSVSAQTAVAIANDRLTENQTGKTIISRANRITQYLNTYMIISRNGTVIVADPYRVFREIKADVVTATHEDYDHVDRAFLAAHTGRKSIRTVETFSFKAIMAFPGLRK
jgi:hypothetical protein